MFRNRASKRGEKARELFFFLYKTNKNVGIY